MTHVTLDHVTKIYPTRPRPVTALHAVTLEARPGEYLAILGPSGCGKTTLLRLIAGLDSPTSGRIRIGDRDAADLPPSRRGVGMVFQSYALYPHLTVRQNLALAARSARLPRDEVARRILHASHALGLEQVLDRTPGRLSGGERQRTALGRCLVRRPDVILLDEPLSNLDAPLRTAARADLKALQRRIGGTTIHVTHDQEEAMSLGDRLAVMSPGRLEQIGPPLDVYHRPANRFVAAFLGSPPMNFLPGRIERLEGLVFIESGSSGLHLPIPPNLAPRFAPALGRPVVLGFRPAMLFPPTADDPRPRIPLMVHAVEPLGHAIDIRGITPAGHAVVARQTARHLAVAEQPLTLALDMALAHLFEEGPFGRCLTADGGN